MVWYAYLYSYGAVHICTYDTHTYAYTCLYVGPYVRKRESGYPCRQMCMCMHLSVCFSLSMCSGLRLDCVYSFIHTSDLSYLYASLLIPQSSYNARAHVKIYG